MLLRQMVTCSPTGYLPTKGCSIETGNVHENPLGHESKGKEMAGSPRCFVGKSLLVTLICRRILWWGTIRDGEEIHRKPKTS